MSTLLLVVGAVSLLAALTSLVRLVKPYDLVMIWFFLSWPLTEVPYAALLAEAIVGGALVALGALDDTRGVVGLALLLASWPALVVLQRRAALTAGVVDAALAESGLPVGPRRALDRRLLLMPFRQLARGVRTTKNISYGPGGRRNTLDVHAPAEPVTGAPVLIFIHGGAWVVGSKDQQGHPLISHLVERGWVCVSVNYRLSPKAKWPAHADDVRLALAWVREHIAEHGGDPGFIALSGGSAGGHLTAVVGLDPAAGVQAAVPCYGVYDVLNSNKVRGRRNNMKFLAKWVFGTDPEVDVAGWRAASPLTLVTPDAPPFFVLHGVHDSLLMVEDTRYFVAALRAVSNQPVAYAELPGAQHQFDMFWSLRALEAVEGIGRFLEAVRSQAARSEAVRSQAPAASAAKDSRSESA